MKKLLLLPLLVLAASCHSKADLRATGHDALAIAAGHWEWDRTTIGFGSDQAPARLGHTRQLVFTAEGQVLIGHNGQVVKTSTYQLSMGTLAGCGAGQPSAPIIEFESEAGFATSARKAYRLSTDNGILHLSFTGDYACVDGGAYEAYHWVAD